MKVIVRDQCGSVELPSTAITLELDTPVRYRWECPTCLTERWGRVSETIAVVLAERGVKTVVPLTEAEIDEWVESARRHHFLAGVE